MADLQKIVDDLSSLTVLEAAELAKLLEEKWGVSAAAAVAVAGPAGGGAAAAPVEEKTEFTVVLAGCRRQEDRGHQGSPRHHRSRPEGSQGPRRGRAEARQGRREQGRGREGQGPAREGWREGRAEVTQVTSAKSRASEARPGIHPNKRGAGRAGSGWIQAKGVQKGCLVRVVHGNVWGLKRG